MVDHDGKGLAGVSRELAYLDAQGGRPQRLRRQRARTATPGCSSRATRKRALARFSITQQRRGEVREYQGFSGRSRCPEPRFRMPATARAQVQVSQSGWQWGNPTPQGNTIRAMDFIAGRGYAIGDDGTALRTDDGGATWTGLATGTSQDLTRVQAVTPDVVVVLGGDGCVVRRSDDGGKTFRKIYVLAETNCPDQVAAAYFVTPQIGYLLLRNGNVLRTTDGGQTFGRVTAIPGTPGSSGGGQGVPADAIFTTPDAGIVFLAGTNTRLPHDRRGRVLDARARRRARQRRSACSAVSATTFYAFGPDTLLRSTDAGQTWQRRGAGAGNTITGIGCATDDLCLLTHRPRRQAAAHRERRRHGRRRSPPRTAPLYAAGFANPHPRGRGRRGRRDRRSPTTAGATTRRSAATSRGSLPVRPAARPGAGHRARARRARPARAHDRRRP